MRLNERVNQYTNKCGRERGKYCVWKRRTKREKDRLIEREREAEHACMF